MEVRKLEILSGLNFWAFCFALHIWTIPAYLQSLPTLWFMTSDSSHSMTDSSLNRANCMQSFFTFFCTNCWHGTTGTHGIAECHVCIIACSVHSCGYSVDSSGFMHRLGLLKLYTWFIYQGMCFDQLILAINIAWLFSAFKLRVLHYSASYLDQSCP